MSSKISRRGLLQVGAAVGGGLLVRMWLPEAHAATQPVPVEFKPNAWLRIDANRMVFTVASAEMGQGVTTSLPTILCEELDLDPRKLQLELAAADRAYDNPEVGLQITGGSQSVKSFWNALRTAGAITRERLKAAAAKSWGVPVSEVTVDDGKVLHKSGKSVTYQQLAEQAAAIDVSKPALKPPSKFKWIGKPSPRLDLGRKVDGSGVFGIDVKIPDLRVAVLARSPVIGGKVKSFDATEAKAMPGVEDIVNLDYAVGVVAKTYWHARQAADALKIEWDPGKNADLSSAGIRERFKKNIATDKVKKQARKEGDPELVAKAAKKLKAVYEAPYLAHATMEPLNATAHVTQDGAELWVPSQAPGIAKLVASDITGLPMSKIQVNTTLLGGGFGRKASWDFVSEAVRLSQATKKPVKVVWSREDDIRHDQFRPYSYHELEGGLDEKGNLVGWVHKLATTSMFSQVAHGWLRGVLPDGAPSPIKSAFASALTGMMLSGVDPTAVEGSADTEYSVPNLRVDWYPDEPGIPLAPWRSVGHSFNAFVVESFVDELAHAAGQDPLEFRLKMLDKAHRSRWLLELIADKAGWGKPLPKGVYRGIAQHASFHSFAAAVAEVSVEDDQIKVRRVVIGMDCGIVVNPDIVAAQLEGATIFGLSAALKGNITLEKGGVVQSNFHDYEMVRMLEAPKIETYVMPTEAAPSGVGEPGVPVIAPAVANAVFMATGKRLRKLPLSLTDADVEPARPTASVQGT